MTTAAPVRPHRAPERDGLSRTADGRPVPSATERARSRIRGEDPFVGWVASLAVTLLALFLRLWKLGTPHEFLFDETYYAKDAWSLLHFGYARDYVDGDKANAAILAGHPDGLWKDTASMAVHPDVGKWLIALGEKAFGMDPFGWRIASAIVGSLMILVMCRLVRRMTGSTAARPGRGAAALLRRPAARALAASRCWTSSWRSSCCWRCTATWPTATGTAPGWPP